MYDKDIKEIRHDINVLMHKMGALAQYTRSSSSLLTAEGAALLTGYSVKHLYKLAEDGVLKCYRPTKRRMFFEREDIENWIRQSKIE